MDNLLDKYHLIKLNQDQVSKLNRPITAEEIGSLSTKKKPRTRWCQFRILQDFHRKTNTNNSQIIPQSRNKWKQKQHGQTLLMSLQLPSFPKHRKKLLRNRITHQSHSLTLMQKDSLNIGK